MCTSSCVSFITLVAANKYFTANYDLQSLVSTSLIFGTSLMHMLLKCFNIESRLSEEVLSSIINSHVFGLVLTPLHGSNTIPSIPVNLDSDAEHSVQDINSPEKNAPPIQKPKKVTQIFMTLNHLQMIVYTC
ncbi:hypothetical protein ACJX0J_033527 [Zea mays]